ncbi:unnamed protein product [Medioppia subpectinata]|uniref:non-specific serine/threonine protein kinase n=1 Tax=Medioppia subpectinata TaxID=1979941 RepID=A0A7R9KM20_9ACAR|nr:unnamed protein product [Medioppia subpectinata]CAG2106110.1 unnamed protein product [Medioppia subpectinata]
MSEMEVKADNCGKVVNEKYTICSTIGKGAYGICYEGLDVQSGQRVAIKVDTKGANSSSLVYETRIYKRYLSDLIQSGTKSGIPALLWAGAHPELGHIMVMDRLGADLEKLFQLCGQKFSTKTLLMIAVQAIDVLAAVHSRGLIHRDIKPENFLMGPAGGGPQARRLYIIDFGLSKPYVDRRTGAHIPFRDSAGMTGTPRYCSVGAGKGHEQSRRDDLESVGYMLAYFHQGQLPWQGMKGIRRQHKNAAICAVKDSASVQRLFDGLSPAFADFLSAAKLLAFTEEPDYSHWTDRFRQLVDEFDYKYDWDAVCDTTATPGLSAPELLA